MGKLFLKVLGTTILSSFILFASFSVNAQMECRSMIGAHLTPFKTDGPILWAIEGTMAPGIMTSPFLDEDNTKLNGGMILGALDFKIAKRGNIYLEGGFKNWINSEFVEETEKSSRHLGMRQAFYSFSGDNIKLKFGLHETKLGDFFLIDERIMGASVDKSIGAFTLNVRGGTVMKDFARMGNFCANRHLYGMVNPDYTEMIGEKPGETNLFGFAVNWDPHYKKIESGSSSSDEFSDSSDEFHTDHDFNEFGDSDEFSDEPESKFKQLLSVKNVGLIVYNEFGDTEYIPENKLYVGSLVDLDLPFKFFVQTGAVYQNMEDNNAVVYIAKFGRNVTWDNASNTKISGAYIGKYNIDDNALFQPLFSNLFLGEIMRLDATEFPLWQAAVKHRFPGKLKFHVGLKAVAQIEDAEINEQDIEIGIMAFKHHLKVTLIGSRVKINGVVPDSNFILDEFYMARVEMRLAF